MATATWTKIAALSLPRSSHSLSLVNHKAYIFGGEIEARKPVDNAVHVVDINSGDYESVLAPGAPPARVGHVAAVLGPKIYIFGGRSVADMGAALDEHGAVQVFDTEERTWSTLKPEGTFPCARSYHCATAADGKFIIHAGCGNTEAGESATCGTKGRLWDAWSFDVALSQWTRLADSPEPARGGTSITNVNNQVYRFGGFSGVAEVGGAVDSLKLGEAKWETKVFGATEGLGRSDEGELKSEDGPGPRSVAGLHGVGNAVISLYGEGKPSPTGGHDAAGNFWDDVWRYDVGAKTWSEVKVAGEKPSPRGWFASDASGDRVVVWGGLNAQNERMGDGWVLQFV